MPINLGVKRFLLLGLSTRLIINIVLLSVFIWLLPIMFVRPLWGASYSGPFGEYTLTQAKIAEGIWYFQISEEPKPLSATLNVSPMLSDPNSIDTESQKFTPFQVTTLNGEPTITVSADDGRVIFSFAAFNPENRLAGLTFYGENYTHIVGLGASFEFTSANINYLGNVFDPSGNIFGTTFVRAEPGRQQLDHASGLQAPICYALGPDKETGAIFVNETRPLLWDFTAYPWTVTLKGPLPPSGAIGFFIFTAPDLPSIRRAYMQLVGFTPPPPRSVFYPWILENTNPIPPSGPVATDYFTRIKKQFPEFNRIGFVYSSQNAALPFNEAKAAGVELLVTESPYVPITSNYFPELSKRGFLSRSYIETGPPLVLKYNNIPSSLLDYTNPAAASYWHSLVRQNIVDLGGEVFYLTGGEPEVYSPFAWYRGVSDPSSHSHYAWANRFSLKWMEAIRLSLKNQLTFFSQNTQHFILSRSGLGGMSRYGTGIFTVDPNLGFAEVAAQARAHINLSGIDFYTTDVTPLLSFITLDQAETLYEAWFSRNGLLNLPLMVPDVFINTPWAKQVLYQKAKLEPYYYSLSHHLALNGDPISSPLLYYFQEDTKARDRVFETMLGKNLLIVAGIAPGTERVEFYLPKGRWYSIFDEELIVADDGLTMNLPSKHEGLHLSPILLRSGAIIPTWDKPENPDTLPAILIFPSEEESSFLWYEEDISTTYRKPDEKDDGVRITTLTLTPLQKDQGSFQFSIKSDQTNLPKGHDTRAYILKFVGIGNVRTATLDDELYDRVTSVSVLNLQESGWTSTGNGVLVFKTPPVSIGSEHIIVIK
jgi:alpha-glucosidase